MRYAYLNKADLEKFVELIKKTHKVVAPIKKENQFVFSEVEGADEITLDYIPTILPPKKYFFPQKQTLGTFKTDRMDLEDTSVEIEPLAIFAAHTCDIDGMECLDVVFRDKEADPYYLKREKSIIIIGYECMFPCDKYATCITMGTHVPRAGYDIMMSAGPTHYILHINSNAGDDLIGSENFFTEISPDEARIRLKALRDEKLKKFNVSLTPTFRQLAEIFQANSSYESDVWNDVGKRCVSCGNCTAVCPTCYCFDIYDELNLNMKEGERKRIWDSCQLDEFATVAGGENFRRKRSSRQRHRYYRKFDYPARKYNKFFCTGCGRCTRACMAGISLIETVNDLAKEYSRKVISQ